MPDFFLYNALGEQKNAKRIKKLLTTKHQSVIMRAPPQAAIPPGGSGSLLMNTPTRKYRKLAAVLDIAEKVLRIILLLLKLLC